MISDDSNNVSEAGWIQWFCGLEDHKFFCEVDTDFIKDNFNLYGLKKFFNRYDEALEMILDPQSPDENDLEDQTFLDIYQQAMDLYGLIHTRYIVCPKGL